MCRHFDVTGNLLFLHSEFWEEIGVLNRALFALTATQSRLLTLSIPPGDSPAGLLRGSGAACWPVRRPVWLAVLPGARYSARRRGVPACPAPGAAACLPLSPLSPTSLCCPPAYAAPCVARRPARRSERAVRPARRRRHGRRRGREGSVHGSREKPRFGGSGSRCKNGSGSSTALPEELCSAAARVILPSGHWTLAHSKLVSWANLPALFAPNSMMLLV
ncbi:hypothetical protein U9M48_013837 [Paspalum notatum var. saurae]|uniref:Uncharacterized protein n=1 Tax=Paspalum notatum var. saurae TaxID=547442 RepID=A0AAQ3WK21_PASNO